MENCLKALQSKVPILDRNMLKKTHTEKQNNLTSTLLGTPVQLSFSSK